MRDIGGLPGLGVWFLSNLDTLHLADANSLQVTASCVLASNGTFFLSPVCGDGLFFANSIEVGQVLPSCAVASLFQIGSGLSGCVYDPVNRNLLVGGAGGGLTAYSVANWTPVWSVASAAPFDIDANSNVLAEIAGKFAILNAATGAVKTLTAISSGTARFDGLGNIVAAVGPGLTKFSAGFASTLWTAAIGALSFSVGDYSVWAGVQSGNTRSIIKLSLASGLTVATVPGCTVPCAIQSDQCVALALILGTSGPLLARITSAGTIAATGDRISYTTNNLAIAEPACGRIGVDRW